MYYVFYWKFEAKVFDWRVFNDMNELMDWMQRDQKFNTIAIIGIYDKTAKVKEIEKAIDNFKKFIKE